MRSKLIKTRFYLYSWNLPLCFDIAPSRYDKKGKSFYGWVLLVGEYGPAAATSWNWLETKNINKSEHVLERDLFA